MWFKPFSNGWFAATWLIDWLTWRRSWRRIVSVANATRRTLYAMKRHQSQHGKLYGCVVWTQQQGYLTWEVPLPSRLNGLGSINRGTLVVPQEIKKVIQNCVLREICVQTDRQTDRHTHRRTPLPYCRRSNNQRTSSCAQIRTDLFRRLWWLM